MENVKNERQRSSSIVPDSAIYSIIRSWSVNEEEMHLAFIVVRYVIYIDVHDNAIIWQFKAHRTKHYLHYDPLYKQNCIKTKINAN